MIKTITFTGADDTTKYEDMFAISQKYPYVEWGILISQKHSGVASRYPSMGWVYGLADFVKDNPMTLSMHVCGKYCRDILVGVWPEFTHELYMVINRIQLNFHDETTVIDTDKFMKGVIRSWGVTRDIICQMDFNNHHVYDAVKQLPNVVPLFDTSGGTGVVPDHWPVHAGKYCGYAGGLGPDNLKSEVYNIMDSLGSSYDNDIWIDMETKVRTNEVFDLSKVVECLEILKVTLEDIYS